MKARPTSFLAASLAAGVSLVAGLACAAQATPPTPESPVIANAPQHSRYPTFKQVPPAPKDVRAVPEWKAAVVAVQKDGQELAQQQAAEPWTLAGTEDWADRARAEATPPPPALSATDPATEAVAAHMRARAKEPPRKR